MVVTQPRGNARVAIASAARRRASRPTGRFSAAGQWTPGTELRADRMSQPVRSVAFSQPSAGIAPREAGE